jgi:hypothetical protein
MHHMTTHAHCGRCTQLRSAAAEEHPASLVDEAGAASVAGLPAAGPPVLCAWLLTYAQRLRAGVYRATRERARSELVCVPSGGARARACSYPQWRIECRNL